MSESLSEAEVNELYRRWQQKANFTYMLAAVESILATRDAGADELRQVRAAVELTVQDVRAQRGDHIARLVEDSFDTHLRLAMTTNPHQPATRWTAERDEHRGENADG